MSVIGKYSIALGGAPASGKTSVANYLTGIAKHNGISLYNVNEHARFFLDQYGPNSLKVCGPLIQLELERHQKVLEDQVPNKSAGFVTDSPLFLSWVYTLIYPGEELPTHIARTTSYKTFLESFKRYTHIFYLPREKPYINDGCRTQTEEESDRIGEAIKFALKAHGVNFIELKGSVKERAEFIWDTVFKENNYGITKDTSGPKSIVNHTDSSTQ